MPNWDKWYAASKMAVISSSRRAVDAWGRISDKPASITLTRQGAGTTSTLTAQTVRIEFDETEPNDVASPTTQGVPRMDLVIFGVKGHPTIADTNLQDGDRFRYEGKLYEVRDVIVLPGEVQARAVRHGK